MDFLVVSFQNKDFSGAQKIHLSHKRWSLRQLTSDVCVGWLEQTSTFVNYHCCSFSWAKVVHTFYCIFGRHTNLRECALKQTQVTFFAFCSLAHWVCYLHMILWISCISVPPFLSSPASPTLFACNPSVFPLRCFPTNAFLIPPVFVWHSHRFFLTCKSARTHAYRCCINPYIHTHTRTTHTHTQTHANSLTQYPHTVLHAYSCTSTFTHARKCVSSYTHIHPHTHTSARKPSPNRFHS